MGGSRRKANKSCRGRNASSGDTLDERNFLDEDDEEFTSLAKSPLLRERSKYEVEALENLLNRQDGATGALDQAASNFERINALEGSGRSRVIVVSKNSHEALSLGNRALFDALDILVEFDADLPKAAHRFFAETAGNEGMLRLSAVLKSLLPAMFGEKKRHGPVYLLAPPKFGKSTAALFAATVAARRAYDARSAALRLNAAPRAIMIMHSTAEVATMLKLVNPSGRGRSFSWASHFGLTFQFLLGPLRKEDMVNILLDCDVLCCDPHNLLELLTVGGSGFTDWDKVTIFFDDAAECLKRMGGKMEDLLNKMFDVGMKNPFENGVFLAQSWTRDLEGLWSSVAKSQFAVKDNSQAASKLSQIARESQLIFVNAELACAVFMNISAVAFYMMEEDKASHFKLLIDRLVRQPVPVIAIFAKEETAAEVLHSEVVAVVEAHGVGDVDIVLVTGVTQFSSTESSKRRKVFVWTSDLWANRGHQWPLHCDHVVHWDLGKEAPNERNDLHDFEGRLGAFAWRWKAGYARAVASNDIESFRRDGPKMSVYVTVDKEQGAAIEKLQAIMDARPDAGVKPYIDVNHRHREGYLAMVSKAIKKADAEKQVCPEFEMFFACNNPGPVCRRHWLRTDPSLEKRFPRGAVVKVQCFKIQGGSVYNGVPQGIDETLHGRTSRFLNLDYLMFLDDFKSSMFKLVKGKMEGPDRVEKGKVYVLRWFEWKEDYGSSFFRVQVLDELKGEGSTLPDMYRVYLIDFGATKDVDRKACLFYNLPEQWNCDQVPGFAMTFINIDIVPVNNAPKWHQMSRRFIERSLQDHQIAGGKKITLKAAFGFFCGKVELVAENRVYLSSVIADDAVIEFPLRNLQKVNKCDLLGYQLVEDAHASWARRAWLPEPGTVPEASGVKREPLVKKEEPAAPLVGEVENANMELSGEVFPENSPSSARKGRGSPLPLPQAQASSLKAGLPSVPPVKRQLAVIEESPGESSKVPIAQAPPSDLTNGVGSSNQKNVTIEREGLTSSGDISRGVEDRDHDSLLEKLLPAAQDGNVLNDGILDWVETLAEESAEESDEDDLDVSLPTKQVSARHMESSPPKLTTVKILPSEAIEGGIKLEVRRERPPVMLFESALVKGNWTIPKVEWADLRNNIMLEVELPILYPDLYQVEVKNGHFRMLALQDQLYKVEFAFGAPVIHDQAHVLVKVMSDRVKGRISVKIFKKYAGPWEYLIEPGEKKKHRWLRLNLERMEIEEEDIRKKVDELDDAAYDLYSNDPSLSISSVPVITPDEARKYSSEIDWEPEGPLPRLHGDLAYGMPLCDAEFIDEVEAKFTIRPLDMADEPEDRQL